MLTTLLGLDGMLGDRGDARYFLYPFAAAVFAIVGFIAIFRAGTAAARRLMWFGLGYLAALTGTLLFLFVYRRGVHPAWRICTVHRGGRGRGARRIDGCATYSATEIEAPAKLAAAASVIVLDLLLVVSLATEAAVRLSAQPAVLCDG